jgi:hypothetical protein
MGSKPLSPDLTFANGVKPGQTSQGARAIRWQPKLEWLN